MDTPRFRRPARLRATQAEYISGGGDPAELKDAAHATARALLEGAAGANKELLARLVNLVEREGIEELARLWSHCGPETLPGAMWRLYLVRQWVERDPEAEARVFRAGRAAEVAAAIAGVVDLPGPGDVRATADAILTGAFTGRIEDALQRASAFLQVLATGYANLADELEPAPAASATARAALLARTSQELACAARLASAGGLE